MLKDFRYAARTLLRRPVFTAVVVCTLGLGLAANGAIFTFVDIAFFRPLAVERPEQLAHLSALTPQGTPDAFSYLDCRDIQDAQGAFSETALWGGKGAILDWGEGADVASVQLVSGNYFSMLGVQPQLGRLLTTRDDRPGGAPGVAVVSHRLWRRLGGTPDVVGKTLRLNGFDFTIVGVAPAGFHGLNRFGDSAAWIPVNMRPLMLGGRGTELESRGSRWFQIIGRLRPGTSLEAAAAQMDAIVEGLDDPSPAQSGPRRALVQSESELRLKSAIDNGAFLMAMVFLALLIACANVGNLFLAQTEGRTRETALRTALGASRRRLVAGRLCESLWLSAGGAILGLLLAAWLIRLLPALLPGGYGSLADDLTLDRRVLVFTALMALWAALISGLPPALRGSRIDLVAALKDLAGPPPGRRGFALRNLLVVSQVALSLALLAGAGLLLRSFLHSARIPLGFDGQRNIVYFGVIPQFQGYQGERLARFYEEYRRRLEALPGVRSATVAARVPLDDVGGGRSAEVAIPGREVSEEEPPRVLYTMVGPAYFDTFGTRIERGRPIDERDTPTSDPVAVVNRTAAERFWPNQDPLGRTLRMGASQREIRIVGVAENSKINWVHESPTPYFFVPLSQFEEGEATYAIHLEDAATGVLDAARAQLRELAPGLSVLDVRTVPELVQTSLSEDRLAAWLATGLALLGLLLATIGLYGVMALYTVRRTREMGIRLAFGARPRDLLAIVLGQGLRLTLTGAVIGVALGLALSRLLAHRIHGVAPGDPSTLAAAVLILLAVSTAACFFPARRAAALDPVRSLRRE